MKTKMTLDLLLGYMSDHTQKEAATYFGVSVRTVARRLESLGLRHHDIKSDPVALTSDQEEIARGWGGKRLGRTKALEIRNLDNTTDYTQRELALMYGVSEGTIWRVVNNVVYKKHGFGFGGSATATVTFRVEPCQSGIRTDRFSN
jgi:predicted DNA-binding protein (UPF0251 family)